jgi:hypothetical protein
MAACWSLCAAEGFEPRIGYTSDDMVVMQALVAAGERALRRSTACKHAQIDPKRPDHRFKIRRRCQPGTANPEDNCESTLSESPNTKLPVDYYPILTGPIFWPQPICILRSLSAIWRLRDPHPLDRRVRELE